MFGVVHISICGSVDYVQSCNFVYSGYKVVIETLTLINVVINIINLANNNMNKK